jgi:hypothetical protein
MRFGLLSTYVAAIAIVTWREVKLYQRTPEPKYYVRVAIVWGILGVVAELGVPELAALFGLGFVLAMLYDFYANSGTVGTAEGSNPITPIDNTTPLPAGPSDGNPFL